jgi:hypothetical protein
MLRNITPVPFHLAAGLIGSPSRIERKDRRPTPTSQSRDRRR